MNDEDVWSSSPCEVRDKQDEINKKKTEVVKTLSPEDQKKFDAISEVCNILNNNEIPFYLFGFLPAGETNEIWQWNSISRYLEDVGDNQWSEKSLEKVSEINIKILNSMLYYFHRLLQGFVQGKISDTRDLCNAICDFKEYYEKAYPQKS